MKQQKLSRRDKEELAKKGICWKCGENTVKKDKKGIITCSKGCFTFQKV